jgi:adenylate cyclase
VHGDQAIGMLDLYRDRTRPYGPREIALLETFADQATIALAHTRLFQELQRRTTELAELNRTLEARVDAQVKDLERVGRLRRYLAPQLADLIVSSGDESMLESHRRQITVVFCDLRWFTAFAETAEPEEVMGVLGEYHAVLGELVRRFAGTIEHFAGDGLLVFFNDPVPQPDHAARAVRMAVGMRERVSELARGWRRQGYELGFGVGIAMGYATLGRIGFEGRFDYAAIGTVTNLAARLSGEAANGQILISGRVHGAVEQLIEGEELAELTLKGFHRPVAAVNVAGLRE